MHCPPPSSEQPMRILLREQTRWLDWLETRAQLPPVASTLASVSTPRCGQPADPEPTPRSRVSLHVWVREPSHRGFPALGGSLSVFYSRASAARSPDKRPQHEGSRRAVLCIFHCRGAELAVDQGMARKRSAVLRQARCGQRVQLPAICAAS